MAENAWKKSAMFGFAMGVMFYFVADAPRWATILFGTVCFNVGLSMYVLYEIPKRVRDAIESVSDVRGEL